MAYGPRWPSHSDISWEAPYSPLHAQRKARPELSLGPWWGAPAPRPLHAQRKVCPELSVGPRRGLQRPWTSGTWGGAAVEVPPAPNLR